MQVAVIGAPLALGQSQPGVGLAPKTMRRAGLIPSLEGLGYEVHDVGDIVFPKAQKHQAQVDIPSVDGDAARTLFNDKAATSQSVSANISRLKNASEIAESCHLIAQKVKQHASQGDFCLTLGGDHSIALGTIPGILAARPNTSVIWVDAHGDFNTPESSPSGNFHGMPLAMTLGYGNDAVAGFEWLKEYNLPSLSPSRVALVGVRSLDSGERRLIKEAGLHVYTMSDIDRYGIGAVMERAMAAVNGDGRQTFHVSFDIDAVDPSEAPGTGTMVKGGLSYRESHTILEMLAATGKLTSMDLAEINPEFDRDGITTALGVELVASALGKSIF